MHSYVTYTDFYWVLLSCSACTDYISTFLSWNFPIMYKMTSCISCNINMTSFAMHNGVKAVLKLHFSRIQLLFRRNSWESSSLNSKIPTGKNNWWCSVVVFAEFLNTSLRIPSELFMTYICILKIISLSLCLRYLIRKDFRYVSNCSISEYYIIIIYFQAPVSALCDFKTTFAPLCHDAVNFSLWLLHDGPQVRPKTQTVLSSC